MASYNDHETGFSESDIRFAYKTFLRDCPDGYCSKRKFLAFLRKGALHTPTQKPIFSKLFLQILVIGQHYRQTRTFFSMMFDIYDRNHDGQLDFNEYIYALSALTGANRLRTIETLYNFFDINNQGYITRNEFNARKKLAAKFLGQYKTGINDNLSYEQAFNAMDVDKDGRISKEEFIQWHLQDHMTPPSVKPVKKRTRILKNLSTLVDIRGQIKTSSLQLQDTSHNNNNNNNNDDNTNNNPTNNNNSISTWLIPTTNQNNKSQFTSSPISMNSDRRLVKAFRRARNHFIQHLHTSNDELINKKRISFDNKSDSGVFTSSSRTNFNDDIESNSLLDIDEDNLQSIDTNSSDDELLCQSLEAVLAKTLMELKQNSEIRSHSPNMNIHVNDDDQVLITRL